MSLPHPADQAYLTDIMSAGYNDWTGDEDALAACIRLGEQGFCHVVWDGPAWRVYQSTEEREKTRQALDPDYDPDAWVVRVRGLERKSAI